MIVIENPSAFPWANEADKQYNWINRGMTLRDYFAAQAMQVFLQNQNSTTTHDATAAYLMADEMMKARDA